MLGHVAQSIGGALPGGLSVNPLLSQAVITNPATTSLVVPPEAQFAFAEVVSPGGYTSPNSNAACAASGGAGNDGILSVTDGETLSVVVGQAVAERPILTKTSISRGGTVLLTANTGQNVSNTSVVYPVNGATGKYPGGPATSATQAGSGGGRLGGAGRSQLSGSQTVSGPGGGGASSGTGVAGNGGTGLICLTFFRTYDDALAFANALYGGAWTP